MNRTVFQNVLDKINTVLRDRDDDVMAIRNVKGNKNKLYATLRFLAGGSPWDICLACPIGFGSFYAKSDRGVIWPIMKAINKTYNISLDVSDTTKLDKMAKEFADIMPVSAEVFDGCILALDGLVIMTKDK
jgi:hypothetical protein